MKNFPSVLVAALLASAATPAYADVKTGVDAWAQGDYEKAVAQWRPLAQAGDADALFNLGQAYKLGRGVPANMELALEHYRKAMEKGHEQAEDNYGLLLFQQNRRAEAIPHVLRSAERGEPRAQYLAGTALFNGDHVAKNWPKAYAYMVQSAASGITQASDALAVMDQYVPADQKAAGMSLAQQMQAERQEALASTTAQSQQAAAPAAPRQGPAAPVIRRDPEPVRTAQLPPSQPAEPPVETAPPVTQAAPEETAAAVVQPTAKTPPTPSPAKSMARATPSSAAPAKPEAATPKPAASGKWRVQLGAFSEAGRADALWKSVSAKVPKLSGYEHFLVKGGDVTRLQAGPLATRADADRLCGAIKAAGADCIVKSM